MDQENNSGQTGSFRAALRYASFQDLKRQLWQLQILLTIVVVVLAFMPPTIFFILELGHLQRRAQHHAKHFASIITSKVEKSGFSINELSDLLQAEMGPGGIISVRLVGEGGAEIVKLGPEQSSFLPAEATAFLDPAAAPLREIRLEVDDDVFLLRIGRVIGIHLLVATLFVIAIHRIGVRPLRRAMDELEAMQAQLIHSEKLGAIGEIYASLTHEINNPLGVIVSKVDLMRAQAKEKQLSPEVLKDLQIIQRHGARIAEIIRGLLAFSRTTSFDRVDTDLNRVIDEIVSLVDRPFLMKQIRIECFLARDLPHIAASSPHLQQVFLNLLNNARDAMPQGGTITIRTYRNGRSLVTEFKDTGTGIAEDIRERIFEPFFTTKDVGRGTGLGLSVSYGIIKAHGGDIEVESSLGKGTLFRLSLPLEGTQS